MLLTDGQHVISRVETHLSDGSTQVSGTLTADTIRLLAKLHPNIFPEGSLLQVSGVLQAFFHISHVYVNVSVELFVFYVTPLVVYTHK